MEEIKTRHGHREQEIFPGSLTTLFPQNGLTGGRGSQKFEAIYIFIFQLVT
jgi:hypothetical protein